MPSGGRRHDAPRRSSPPDRPWWPSLVQLHAAEGIVRGHKSGLLTVADYNNLVQCENLEDIKLNLVRRRRRPAGAGQEEQGGSRG